MIAYEIELDDKTWFKEAHIKILRDPDNHFHISYYIEMYRSCETFGVD